MGRSLFETLMGALVLIVAGCFLSFAYQSSSLRPVEGYALKAQFSTVSGIGTGTDVRLGGIKIGVVSDMMLDPKTYNAVITLQIQSDIKLPTDSSAAIVSDGLLGNKYVKIEPGADDKMLAAGQTITITQSAVNLEELIGKMAFGGVDANKRVPAAGGSTTGTPQTPAKPNAPAAANP